MLLHTGKLPHPDPDYPFNLSLITIQIFLANYELSR